MEVAERHIVLTRDRSWHADGAEVAHAPEAALALADAQRISIIGGAEIFAIFEPLATSVELTEVEFDVEGDTYMPAFDPARWREVSREEHPALDGSPPFTFLRLVRTRG
jgi:dihydrofolate reductase